MAQSRGTCFCGCGQRTDKVWASGHDSKALHGLMHLKYGDTRAFLEKHGYGPGRKNLYEELEWLKSGGQQPEEAGAGAATDDAADAADERFGRYGGDDGAMEHETAEEHRS